MSRKLVEMKRCCLALAMLCCVYCEQRIGRVDAGLDPGRITEWAQRWAPAPVVLTSNSKAYSPVTATLYFAASTSISSGVLEVEFPSSFNLTTISTAIGQIVQIPITLLGGSETSVQITNIRNPNNAGAYGPFAVRTRLCRTCQVVDSNLSFGFVYIVEAAAVLKSLSVTLIGPSAVNSNVSLLFSFRLSVSLWRLDSFVIEVDPRWTIGAGATCTSQDVPSHVNNFNGTDILSPHALRCVATEKSPGTAQTLYIYGLAVDGIDVTATSDNQYAEILVTNVRTPDRVYADNAYTWTVATMRFATATVLESGVVTNSPAVTPGVITSADWRTTWDTEDFYLVQGISLYMELSLLVVSGIPQGGSVFVQVSEELKYLMSLTQPVNCYLVTQLKMSNCTTDSRAVYLHRLSEVAPGTTLTIRSKVKLVSSAGSRVRIPVIRTYAGAVNASEVLDEGRDFSFFAVASGALSTDTVPFMLWQFYQGTALASSTMYGVAGGTKPQGGLLRFIAPIATGILPTSRVKISCPIADAVDEFKLYFSPGLKNYWLASNTNMPDLTSGTTPLNDVIITPMSGRKLGTIEWSAAPMVGTQSRYINAVHEAAPGSNSFISAPLYISSLATTYECRMLISDPDNAKPPVLAALFFGVSGRPFSLASMDMPCLDVYPGIPAFFRLSASWIPLRAPNSDTTYFLEFVLSSTPLTYNTVSAYTGISIPIVRQGSPYPHQTSLASTTSAVIYGDAKDSTKVGIIVTGLPEVFEGTEFMVAFPLLNAANGVVSFTVYGGFQYTEYPESYFQTYSSVPTSAKKVLQTPTALNFTEVLAADNDVVNGDSAQNYSVRLKIASSPAVTSTNPWLYFVFPPGTVWTSRKNVTGRGIPPDAVFYFSAPFSTYKYPGVLIRQTPAQVPTALTQYLISGFQLPLGVGTGLPVRVVQGNVLGATCHSQALTALNSIAGQISIRSLLPSSVAARDPAAPSVTFTCSFVLAHGLPATGVIKATIAQAWSTTECGSECYVSGLPRYNTPISCSVSNNTALISGFADFQGQTSVGVTVTLSDLLSPITVGRYSVFQSLETYLQMPGGAMVDQCLKVRESEIQVTATSSLPGSVTWLKIETVPMTAGALHADLYLQFRLPLAVPRCSVLSLSVPLPWSLPVGVLSRGCFLAPRTAQKCELAGSALLVTLFQSTAVSDVLELYVDAAVNIPLPQVAAPFRLSVSWFAVTLITDTPSNVTFAPSQPLSDYITADSITVDPTNSGELATYQLTFHDTAPFAVSDQYWLVFPPEYDAHLGSGALRSDLYYLDCSCAQLGNAVCVVDHNVVAVTGDREPESSSPISLSVLRVANPAPGVTSHFEVYHVQANGQYRSVNQSLGTVSISAVAGKIELRRVSASSASTSQLASYSFQFYLEDTLYADSVLAVQFPKEFALASGSYSCSTAFTAVYGAGTVLEMVEWNPVGSCQSSGNLVLMSTRKQRLAFSSSQLISFTISGVQSPESGSLRTDHYLGESSQYSSYTSKFSLFIYRSRLRTYTSKTFPTLHSGYLGLSTNRHFLSVTAGDGTTNQLTVFTGTTSTVLYITTEGESAPCIAKVLRFFPSVNAADNGMLQVVSEDDNFELKGGKWRCRFRVSAGIGLRKGVYIVQWKTVEEPQAGTTTLVYEPLQSTIITVQESEKNQHAISIGPIPTLVSGTASQPIPVSLLYSPASDLTVQFFSSQAEVRFDPQQLVFAPGVATLYFQVRVGEQGVPGSAFTASVGKSGSIADIYNAPNTLQFFVQHENRATGSLLSWNIREVWKTKAVLTPTASHPGVLYWHLAAQGSSIPSFSALQSTGLSLLGTYRSSAAITPCSESWTACQHRQYEQHLTVYWTGAVLISNTSALQELSVDWLWAGSSYQITGFLDNGSQPTAGTKVFRTLPVPECQPLKVTFQGKVEDSYLGFVGNSVAENQGINPQRLIAAKYSSKRQLTGESTFEYTVAPERSTESAAPSTLTVDSSRLATDLQRYGITAPLQLSYPAPPSGVVPVWVCPPSPATTSLSSLSLTLQPSVAGTACCVALLSDETAPSPAQVMAGLAANSQNAPRGCVEVSDSLSVKAIEVNELSQNTLYFVYCAAQDQYPLWPTLMNERDVTPVLMHTQGTNSTLSSDSQFLNYLLCISLLTAQF